jgi:hypothetical protein
LRWKEEGKRKEEKRGEGERKGGDISFFSMNKTL